MAARRITLVADELRGLQGGGIGTATSHLALALSRMGHHVELLYIATADDEMDAEWARLYEERDVRIRMLERNQGPTDPAFFARMLDVARTLRVDEPDVVITQDLGAPAYVALRLKQLGLAFDSTLFVVFCHGTRRWITDVARKVRVLPGALAVTMLERNSVELADLVVSPSAYLVDWMRRQRWQLPERTMVVPYVTASMARERQEIESPKKPSPIERIVFFGRLEERKGIGVFTSGLNRVDPALLRGVELEFLGVPTKSWPPSRVESLLSERTKNALQSVRFHTRLEQGEALAQLGRPGTLAAMPSLEDNSPNTVYECLERELPFIASRVGGTAELIAPEDHERVLFDPTTEGLAAALTRVLQASEIPRPARAAFDGDSVRQRWAEIATAARQPRTFAVEHLRIDVVVAGAEAGRSSRCLTALERQTHPSAHVIPAPDRGTGARAGASPWVVFLESDDEPEEEFLDTLVRAQMASAADVVTCGVHLVVGGQRLTHLFLGEPGALGILSNGYGTPALVRRSLLQKHDLTARDGEKDADWRLLARLSLAGAAIVSVPLPLVKRTKARGRLGDGSRDAVLVLEEFESAVPRPLDSIARLAAGLAADAFEPKAPASQGVLGRVREKFARARA